MEHTELETKKEVTIIKPQCDVIIDSRDCELDENGFIVPSIGYLTKNVEIASE